MDVNWYRRTQPTVGQVFNCIQVKKVGWYLCSLLLPMDAIWPVAWVPKWWTITWNYKSNGAFPFLGFFFVRCFITATEIKLEYQINEALTEFLWTQLSGVIMLPPASDLFWLWGLCYLPLSFPRNLLLRSLRLLPPYTLTPCRMLCWYHTHKWLFTSLQIVQGQRKEYRWTFWAMKTAP